MRHHSAVLGAALLFALAVTTSTNGQDSSMKPIMKGFHFTPPTGNQGDPDKPAMDMKMAKPRQ